MDKKSVRPLTLRLPVDLHQRLVEAATHADRTLTAEIIRRLDQTFDEPDYSQLPAPVVEPAGEGRVNANERSALDAAIREEVRREIEHYLPQAINAAVREAMGRNKK